MLIRHNANSSWTASRSPLQAATSGQRSTRSTNNSEPDDVVKIGSDWRLMDLRSSSPTSGQARHFTCAKTDVRRYILLLRVEAIGGDRAFGCTEAGNSSNEDIAVVDSILEDQKNNSALPYDVFHVASKRNMFMGNVIGGSAGHNIRIPYAQDFVFTFNYFSKSPNKANFRFHGNEEEGQQTQWVVIGYNTHANIQGGGFNINTVSESFYNPIFDVIVEGNFLPYGNREINFGADRVSARNNVLRADKGKNAMFRIWQRGHKDGPQFDVDNIWIYNNTLVWNSSDTAKMVSLTEQDGGIFRGDASFRENLLYAPGAKVDAFPTGSGFVATGNVIITSSSQNPFAKTSPGTSIADYEIVSTSVTAGATDEWFQGHEGSGGAEVPPRLAAPVMQ